MIKLKNLSNEELSIIGTHAAESFLGEKGCFQVLPHDAACKLFTLIVTTCYQTGHLYTSSEKREGYCVYWTKEERPGLWVQLKMGCKMLMCLPLKVGMQFKDGQSNWKPTEKRYKKADDFVEVFLIAVRKEYQGQGHFRTMLQEPFDLAKKRHTICVLDTDSDVKADKYCHVGMHIVDRKVQKNGMEMFALEK